MGKLKQIRGGLHRLPPVTRYLPRESKSEQTARRDALQAWRRWYKTARWQKLRWDALVRDNFTCRMCGRIEADTSQLVGDHIIPHRGDRELFFDATNVQCLCKPCHDSDKQRAEQAMR